MAQIFISYAREDSNAALRIARLLDAADTSVFWDRQLIPGETWDTTLERELDAANCVVVLWSRASVESQWVRTEATVGLRRNMLVPVMLDGTPPPLAFQLLECADLSGWNGDPTHHGFIALRSGLARVLAPPSAVSPDAVPRARPTATTVKVDAEEVSLFDAVVVGVATLAWVTLLAGFVASRVRDVGLQAKGPFASSARIWLPMGLSSLVFPVVVASAFWLIVKALAFVDQRSGAHLGLGSPWRKLRRDDTVHDSAIRLSVVHGACAVIAVCLFFRFILAVFAFSAQGEPSTYRLLAPDMLKLHVTYRFTWTCIVAVFVPGWAVIASRLVSEKQVRSGVQTLVLGFLLCSASIALWALPYQILWQSSYARVRYGLDACYAVARAFEQELLFCPVTSDPVNRFQVVAADALPQRRQGPCNIFTDLGPAPGAVACRD